MLRQLVAVSATAITLALASPASALEIREPNAHLIVDVPNSWVIGGEGEYVVAHPADNSFHLRLVGTNHGAWQEAEAETWLLGKLNSIQSNVTVDTHGRRIDWGNYVGVEIFGHGTTRSGEAGKWFALVLIDKRNPSKGCAALGSGSVTGFQVHQPGIYTALHSLRTY